MNDLVRINSILNGSADPSVAYELAFKAISSVAFSIGDYRLKDIEKMTRKEANSALANISKHIDQLRASKKLFKNYPEIHSAIDAHITSMFYAETLLIPLFSTCNKDMEGIAKRGKKTYLLKSIATGLVKIGRSIYVSARVKTLQNSSGDGIHVLSILDCDVETQLHQKFQEFRRHGEWFDDSAGAILREFRSMEGRS